MSGGTDRPRCPVCGSMVRPGCPCVACAGRKRRLYQPTAIGEAAIIATTLARVILEVVIPAANRR